MVIPTLKYCRPTGVRIIAGRAAAEQRPHKQCGPYKQCEQNEKYKQVSLGGKLVDIVNKDILTFPGPCKYEQPPAIPLDPICKHGIKRSMQINVNRH